jgi:hypothetical protein
VTATAVDPRIPGRGAQLAVVVGLAFVLLGCAAPTPTPSAASSSLPPSTSPAASPSREPIEPTSGPPIFAGPVTCGDDQAFAADLLFIEGRAETDPDPGADQLRALLAGPDGAGMPATGWVRVADAPGHVQFVARAAAADEWVFAGFSELNGVWQLDVMGQCSPQPMAQAGTSLATWWLDPAFAPPAAGDTIVHALIVERACASGKPPVGRVLEPQVFEDDAWVVVLVTVANVPGGADCPGNPTFPITITLPSPLGDRELFDGSVVPVRDATIPGS